MDRAPEHADELAALDDAGVPARDCARHSAIALGAFALPRARASVFPLRLRVRGAIRVAPRSVLIGNAAQTLHPVAGQGFNLGLRDAWELGATDCRARRDDPGRREFLNRLFAQRRLDRTARHLVH